MTTSTSIVDQTHRIDLHTLGENNPEYFILHSCAKYPQFDSLETYHRQREFAGVGYHIFVDANAQAHLARPLNKEGAHALGLNKKSIGLCYHLDPELRPSTKETVREVLAQLKRQFGNLPIIPHTYAQLLYFNTLLEPKDQLPLSMDVCKLSIFAQYETLVETALISIAHKPQCQQLKKFKICPGQTFYEVISQ
jgi:hypothetical protein